VRGLLQTRYSIATTTLTINTNNFDIDLLATDEPQEESTFLIADFDYEPDTDDYEYQQSTQY